MERVTVERSQVLWHRLRANHLAERLPADSLGAAAFAGLQDSAPRAALTSLYARVAAVGCSDWEHPSLVQTWAPRGAVFIVARNDLPVFALGILPRDPELRRALEQLARSARESVTAPRVKETGELRRGRLPALVAQRLRRRPIPRLIHAIAGVQIRWDGHSTRLLPSPAPEMDVEEARRELARRFLRSLAPAGAARFSRWAAVSHGEARATFDALRGELVSVEWSGGSGLVLAEDVEALETAEPVTGVRFLAYGGDPVLQPGEDVVAADPAHRRAAQPPWASTGLVLLDGEPVAAWGRRAGRITVLPLKSLAGESRHEIETEALGMPVPNAQTQVQWRER